MSKKISQPAATFDAPAMERGVLQRWQDEKTFEKSLAKTKSGKRFTFYDGPPFATGLPHYGHLLQGTIKDIIPRFQTMQGRYVERRFGWDCHGLPVEYELEKERGIKSRQEILEMGVDVFNEACRAIVLRHTKEWEQTTKRLGRWIDFDNDYKTMDPDYMESIWWVVKTLWDKELLYEGRKSMHICPRCATTLSNFEVTQGYRDRQDPAVYVKFPLVDDPGTSLVAWTTTPWTLPGNVLLAVNKGFKYVAVEHQGERLIVAEPRVAAVFGEQDGQQHAISAAELIGKKYEAPFPVADLKGRHYMVVADESVTDTEGTGVLHVAPAFGEEDMRIGEREDAALIQHITMDGHLTDPFPRYHDLGALEANQKLVAELKKSGRLLRHQTITHSYPHCWRCETPLLNYAATQWFVKVTDLKERLLSENQRINWVPEHIRDGRFGQWLEGARDWAISRQRFWGNPLPIWRCGKEHLRVIGSLDELEELSGVRPKDLHKHFVDKITFPCPECKGEMSRIEDVLDCWFESGSMPYAVQHYPFEEGVDLGSKSGTSFDQRFPADFIAEGLDQTRGWFYTLHVLGVALKDSRAFQNVVLTGMIMAEDGKKMSKRLKNYPEPEQIIEQYGADALRLYMTSSPIVRGENLSFAEKGVAEVMRNFTLTLWNVYSFFATYAHADNWTPKPPPKNPQHLLDKWILQYTDELVSDLTADLKKYDLMAASRELLRFLNALSNWYIRRSRRRFWKSENDRDKDEAFATLHHVLQTYCKLAAPFAPFITDRIFAGLSNTGSIHLEDWPRAVGYKETGQLSLQMRAALQIVPLGLAARSKAGIKVRQPLPEARIAIHQTFLPKLDKNIVRLIEDELNVKDISVISDEDQLFKVRLIPIPKEVAREAGNDTQKVINAVKKGEYRISGETVTVAGAPPVHVNAFNRSFDSTKDFVVESNQDVMIALDTRISADLAVEGLAREIIRLIQELRKQAGLEVTDRIRLSLQTEDPDLERAIDVHHDLIAAEVLASSLEVGEAMGQNKQAVTVGGKSLAIGLSKTTRA